MDVRGVTRGTLVRTAVLALALVNTVLAVFGVNPMPVDDGQVQGFADAAYQVCTIALTVGASLRCWWMNNSLSRHARIADAVGAAIERSPELAEQVLGLVDAGRDLAEELHIEVTD